MIELKLIAEEDLINIIKWNENTTSDFLLQWSGNLYSYPLTINQLKYYLRKAEESQNVFIYKIVSEENKMIGDLFVEVVNRKIFVFGYTLDSAYWSQGYATEIVTAFCDYMKNEQKFKKVLCYVYNDNVRSKKLLRRLHFVKFDESYYYDDEGYMKKL